MSIFPQDSTRKVSTESQETSTRSTRSHAPQGFKKLMKVAAVDDAPKEKNFFTLVQEEEEEKEPLCEGPCPTPLPSPASLMSPAISCAAGASAIDPLFETMAARMIVMHASGETETTVFLDNPHFASSIFFGAQITIREFSTAPKVFNVEILAAPAALAYLNAGKQGLIAAFEKGNFNFSVHRIETHIQQEEKPVFHRKENSDRDPQDQKGGREQ